MSERTRISSAFPFRSRFVEVLGSKLHYIDEGSGLATRCEGRVWLDLDRARLIGPRRAGPPSLLRS